MADVTVDHPVMAPFHLTQSTMTALTVVLCLIDYHLLFIVLVLFLFLLQEYSSVKLFKIFPYQNALRRF